ncbi:MAG: hypothetical protein U9P70_02025 [Patescibacteria group bacterium]|nr:hypothetical protein [Patescibacteria group bacterium]
MADNCATCEYIDIEPDDLLKLGPEVGVLTAIEVIPLLWQKKDYEKIIAIASTLPTQEEIELIIVKSLSGFSLNMKDVQGRLLDKLQQTSVAIKGSLSLYLVDCPYYLKEQLITNLHIVAEDTEEGALFWENKLLEVLSSKEKLGGQIKIWASSSKEIKNLIKIFHLPEIEMKGLFRKALKKGVVLMEPGFWRRHFSEIEDFIKVFKIPEEEVQSIFEKIIEGGKKRYPATCLEIAQKMNISVDPQEFCSYADELLEEANRRRTCRQDRSDLVFDACAVYELLKEKYSFKCRENILKMFDYYIKNYYSKNVNKIIFRASKVIGFRYKKQEFWDIHI